MISHESIISYDEQASSKYIIFIPDILTTRDNSNGGVCDERQIKTYCEYKKKKS